MDIDQHPSLFPLKTIISSDDSSYGFPEIIVFGSKSHLHCSEVKKCCKC